MQIEIKNKRQRNAILSITDIKNIKEDRKRVTKTQEKRENPQKNIPKMPKHDPINNNTAIKDKKRNHISPLINLKMHITTINDRNNPTKPPITLILALKKTKNIRISIVTRTIKP